MVKRNNLKQGFFKPRNPKKYNGDPTNIFYRSGWELRVMKYLDENTNVISWTCDGLGSDCAPTSKSGLAIPYLSPIDNRIHRYYPDFLAEIKTADGIKTYLLEVKPKAQTQQPVPSARKTKRYITEVMTWGVNQAKWKNAEDYCRNKGWEFRIITEEDLGLKNK